MKEERIFKDDEVVAQVIGSCYNRDMKDYVHARLGEHEARWLRALREHTGASDSALVKRGLKRLYDEEVAAARSALALCGGSVGKFRSALTDLSDNPARLRGYGR